MTPVLTPEARQLLGDAFALGRGRARVGEALWLYVYLVVHAMRTGHVCRSREHVARDLGVEEATVDAWIATLVATGLIAVQTSGPYLALRLVSWPREAPNRALSEHGTEPGRPVQSNVPVGSSMLLPAGKAGKAVSAGTAGKPGVVGGLGEGEGLLAEAQAVLAVTDLGPLRELLARHPVERIREALRRVEHTPARQIRKSRYAFFRYLLAQPTESNRP